MSAADARETLRLLEQRLASTDRELSQLTAALGSDIQGLIAGRAAAEQQEHHHRVLAIDRAALEVAIEATKKAVADAEKAEQQEAVLAERAKLAEAMQETMTAGKDLELVIDMLAVAMQKVSASSAAVQAMATALPQKALAADGWHLAQAEPGFLTGAHLQHVVSARLALRLGAGWPYDRPLARGAETEAAFLAQDVLSRFDVHKGVRSIESIVNAPEGRAEFESESAEHSRLLAEYRAEKAAEQA